MSTVLRIVSPDRGVFGVVHVRPDKTDMTRPLEPWDEVCAHDGTPIPLVRLLPGRGYAINEGPCTVQVRYRHKGAFVGPRTDFIAPGQCKELGIGKNVEWVFTEV